jgi:Flp pilus assembly CpaE family ATPase
VLLVDADTVTGHVTTSLGIDGVRTVMDSWIDQAEGGPNEPFADLAASHPSGLKVIALTSSPLQTEILEPQRVADAINVARRGFDFVVIDLHPSYSALNQAVFELADRILVPVTPDVPALRAAVQLRDLAMEKTVGMEAMALIRSGGLLFVRAANEGRTVIEMFPREKVSEDFDALADRLLGAKRSEPAAKPAFRLFNRAKEPARA